MEKPEKKAPAIVSASNHQANQMLEDDRTLLSEFARRVRVRYPGAGIRAFGSRVRGDARPDSDFDVLVVLDQPVGRAVKREIRDIAWEIGFEQERVFTVLVYERRQVEESPLSASPLMVAIRREGASA